MPSPADSPLSDESRRLLETSARNLLVGIGEEPDREGLTSTPDRVARSLEFLTSGYRMNAEEILRGALFDAAGQDEMVIVKDIEVYSLCEHHLLPFHGRCHVGYLPDGKIVGLSKIPRIVEVFARRLQVQERLTAQIAQCLQDELQPRGVEDTIWFLNEKGLTQCGFSHHGVRFRLVGRSVRGVVRRISVGMFSRAVVILK